MWRRATLPSVQGKSGMDSHGGRQIEKSYSPSHSYPSSSAGTGAFAALPETWTKPIVQSVILPAHAQTSPLRTATTTTAAPTTTEEMGEANHDDEHDQHRLRPDHHVNDESPQTIPSSLAAADDYFVSVRIPHKPHLLAGRVYVPDRTQPPPCGARWRCASV